ncbi:MAG: carbonic anhydrase family protein [Planctomycetota bacterium]
MFNTPPQRFGLASVAGLGLALGLAPLTGCQHAHKDDKKSYQAQAPISAEQQAELTPDDVLADLLAGNERYVKGKVSKPDITERIAATATGQYPQAVILSCLDSRVPVELVFDQGIGDVFVGRVAGNVENEDQLGSMEFATAAAGSKLVLVLGHSSCGAVKGACDDVQLGNLTALLSKIQPAVEAVPGHEGARTSQNAAFVQEVVHKNVQLTVADIRERSEVLRGLEAEGKIKIVGAVYDLNTGKVTLLDA